MPCIRSLCRLSIVVGFTAVASLPLAAQRATAAAVGVRQATVPAFIATESRALRRTDLAADNARRCGTLCTTFVGAFVGAGVGALATYAYNQTKTPADRSIADGPAVALVAIGGAIVGGAIGLTIGLSRH